VLLQLPELLTAEGSPVPAIEHDHEALRAHQRREVVVVPVTVEQAELGRGRKRRRTLGRIAAGWLPGYVPAGAARRTSEYGEEREAAEAEASPWASHGREGIPGSEGREVSPVIRGPGDDVA